MKYHELLELYKKKQLGEEQREKVEQDIERHEAISEYLFEKEEEDILNAIREKCPQNISKPWYGESVKVVETNEEIYTDLIWKEKKVILFLSENHENYQKAKETDFSCYCLNEAFDIDEFISKIEV